MRLAFALTALAASAVGHGFLPPGQRPLTGPEAENDGTIHGTGEIFDKAAFIESLVANMTVEDLGVSVHQLFERHMTIG